MSHLLYIGRPALSRHRQSSIFQEVGCHQRELLVDLVSVLLLEGEQVVLAIVGEHLHCNGLQQVSSFVNLFHIIK